jgi:regulator of protease activity HflC (stomatin/prohibitin superfamily)
VFVVFFVFFCFLHSPDLMEFFGKTYEVKPNTVGYLYRNNALERTLDPGIYTVRDWQNRTELIALPTVNKLVTVTNQEVLTKDNIALRFSFFLVYKISDGPLFLAQFALDKSIQYVIQELEQRVTAVVQLAVRNRIADISSETLNEQRAELANLKTDAMQQQVSGLGVTLTEVYLRDLTFPKGCNSKLFAPN